MKKLIVSVMSHAHAIASMVWKTTAATTKPNMVKIVLHIPL